MGIQRLPIVRTVTGAVMARDGEVLYHIENIKDIPQDYEDGIFTTDPKNGTARFESRQSKPPFITVPWKDSDPVSRSESTRLADGTVVHRLCNGLVILTIKPCEGTNPSKIGFAENNGLEDEEVVRFILVAALAGVDVTSIEFTNALESLFASKGGKVK